MANTLVERQVNVYGPDDYGPSDSWWWSSAGIAVRYSIVIALLVIVCAYFLGGYWHARRRLGKGLQPLPYHRWMVRRQMYYSAQYPYGDRPYYNNGNDAFSAANPHPAPPPAYNSGQAPPPMYQPAETDGSKIAADQHYPAPVHRAGESSTNVPTLNTSFGGQDRRW